MGWEWREGAVELVRKDDFQVGAEYLSVAGGRAVPSPCAVAYSHDKGNRSLDFWFEGDLGHKTLDVNQVLPNSMMLYRMDAIVYPSDGRLKVYFTQYLGNDDAGRPLWVLRTPAFWTD